MKIAGPHSAGWPSFWIFVGLGFGFGFDLHNYLHEQPPVPMIVHVHAIATTLWLLTASALVLMVETGNVRLHRSLSTKPNFVYPAIAHVLKHALRG
ncbi:MAG: hypothetical protein WBR21_02070 [Rouxiella badensis]|uniref:hypothetical protein n=1 Tax=Rouxiella badensis TaxID=1646377 RepID=UPI003C45D634